MSENDLIGREIIVKKISALINNLDRNEHFCLALNGGWGSGKTFVMNMLEEQLKVHKGYFVIKYDAWENSFYSDPLIAILYCLLDGLQDTFYYVRNPKEYIQAALGVAEGASIIAEGIAPWLDNADIVTKILKTVSNVIKGLKKIIKSLNLDKTENPIIKDFKSYKTLLNDIKSCINKLTDFEIYEKRPTKLIILVDEIDRCLPSEQLKILERMHHVLDINNCFVVCSLNKESVIKSFKHNFDNNGDDYLKKFFDREITLEPFSEKYFDQLLDLKLDKISELKNIPISEEQRNQLKEVFNSLIIGIDGLEEKFIDNREIERVLNSFYEVVKNINYITHFNQVSMLAILTFIKNFVKEIYERDILTLGKVGRHYFDFLKTYFGGADAVFVKNLIYLQGKYGTNNYEYSFLNYYNCVLNYYHFKTQEVDFACKEAFKIDRDGFIERFVDIVNVVETYGK